MYLPRFPAMLILMNLSQRQSLRFCPEKGKGNK
jgi:hypothetical protein